MSNSQLTLLKKIHNMATSTATYSIVGVSWSLPRCLKVPCGLRASSRAKHFFETMVDAHCVRAEGGFTPHLVNSFHLVRITVRVRVYGRHPQNRGHGIPKCRRKLIKEITTSLIARTCKVFRIARELSTASADLESRPRAPQRVRVRVRVRIRVRVGPGVGLVWAA